jgi:NTE family protein
VGRIALVLGAGGVAGGAFHAGVLAAIQEATGWDPRSAEVIVGTSAGSITGASLRAGLSAPDMLARAQDRPLSAEGRELTNRMGAVPAFPQLRPVRDLRSPGEVIETLGNALRRPLAARPLALIAALAPEGSIDTDLISTTIASLVPLAWPVDPLWICAVRQRDGRRVVFGRDDRSVPVPTAVAASCAIPSFFRPVDIDEDAYLDGGVHSPTNADLLAEVGDLDLIIVSSPMSREGISPRVAIDQPMRAWSGTLLDREVRRLRRSGRVVVTFQPDDSVLREVGASAMDPARRAPVATAAHAAALERLRRPDVTDRLTALSA